MTAQQRKILSEMIVKGQAELVLRGGKIIPLSRV